MISVMTLPNSAQPPRVLASKTLSLSLGGILDKNIRVRWEDARFMERAVLVVLVVLVAVLVIVSRTIITAKKQKLCSQNIFFLFFAFDGEEMKKTQAVVCRVILLQQEGGVRTAFQAQTENMRLVSKPTRFICLRTKP